MRSMVEGLFGVRKAPPPPFGWSPSPANAGEDFTITAKRTGGGRRFGLRPAVGPDGR
jgi:hypothetical protein